MAQLSGTGSNQERLRKGATIIQKCPLSLLSLAPAPKRKEAEEARPEQRCGGGLRHGAWRKIDNEVVDGDRRRPVLKIEHSGVGRKRHDPARPEELRRQFVAGVSASARVK